MLNDESAATRSQSVREATAKKEEGNALFAEAKYADAHAAYSEALKLIAVAAGDDAAAAAAGGRGDHDDDHDDHDGDGDVDATDASAPVVAPAAPAARPLFAKERAVFLCNRAAAALHLLRYEDAISDCSAALALDADYAKAYLRRATAHEALKQFVAAHDDYAALLRLDPASVPARQALARCAPLADAERQRQKDEMLGKLKDLGNSLLGRFGLSLDNFVAQQDPSTGSYSINFKQQGGDKS
jgi:tetratricopeptide (TPR) repeat protein